jgi:hypothetical protein
VLGTKTQAETLVKDVDDKFAKAAQEHPEFTGATALMATFLRSAPGSRR